MQKVVAFVYLGTGREHAVRARSPVCAGVGSDAFGAESGWGGGRSYREHRRLDLVACRRGGRCGTHLEARELAVASVHGEGRRDVDPTAPVRGRAAGWRFGCARMRGTHRW